MNYSPLGQIVYKKNQRVSEIDVDDPFELIEITLNTLLKSLKILACESLTEEAANKHITKSLTAVYLLQDSIDLDKGGDLSVNLLNVYEHCRLNIIEFSGKRDN